MCVSYKILIEKTSHTNNKGYDSNIIMISEGINIKLMLRYHIIISNDIQYNNTLTTNNKKHQ
ncbi:hypothetical protein E5AUHO_29590 [Citrobacter freundii]|nr:hypothetical protein E5AUHO_29590 [Citrobacter freundii]